MSSQTLKKLMMIVAIVITSLVFVRLFLVINVLKSNELTVIFNLKLF